MEIESWRQEKMEVGDEKNGGQRLKMRQKWRLEMKNGGEKKMKVGDEEKMEIGDEKMEVGG